MAGYSPLSRYDANNLTTITVSTYTISPAGRAVAFQFVKLGTVRVDRLCLTFNQQTNVYVRTFVT